MCIHDRSRRGRTVDTEPQLVQHFRSEIAAVLNSEVLIPRLMKCRESRDEGSRWCRDIGNYRRTVIDHVTPEYRMRVGEVVVDTGHAEILSAGTLVGGDQVPGSVPVICAV